MIALLTDFGLADIYVGVMKSVIQTIDPGAVMVDLTHDVPPQDIRAGAFELAAAWPYLPEGCIAVAVVDPGVGTERRTIAVRRGLRTFVGPDNGLITDVLRHGAPEMAVELTEPRYHLAQRTGDTFHGRDIFAPVAAHLNKGVPLAQIGREIPQESLLRLSPPLPAITDTSYTATVSLIDHYGNVVLSVAIAEFESWRAGDERFGIDIDGTRCGEAVVATSYGNAGGRLALIPDSFGKMEIALPGGSAARRLGRISAGQSVTISRLSV